MTTPFIILCAALIAAKWIAQIWLECLNQRHVRRNAAEVPPAFAGTVTSETYAKSVDYTLAKSRFEIVELTWGAAVLAAVLFSGVLPWFHQYFQAAAGSSIWAGAGFLMAVGVALSAADLPFDWHDQFHLEEHFGFNTTAPGLWWMDRLKGLLLALALGFPLLALILKLAQWLGNGWWFWAWVCLAAWQLVMMLAAPVLILPLFNKFTPLPPGELRDGLLELGRRAGFRARDIQVMDGSKRSRHSNAFFTGFGGFRKIVLFDTLIQQLAEPELAAVLAHEIGHFKKKLIPKTLVVSALGSLAGLYLVSLLAKQDWFYRGFGFEPGSIVPALLLFGLLSGVVTFWFSPLAHWWSRRNEYQADAFAAEVMHEPASLIGALRKLNEKNLSNLTPHPLYSGFYYSHPTLLERERALAGGLRGA
jgi:STE24 endopeptidase